MTKRLEEKIKKGENRMGKILTVGKKSQKEIAEWFGFSYGHFRNYKEKYLKELEEYAKFEVLPRGINIKYVIIPEYVRKDSNYQKVKNAIPANWNQNSRIDRKKEVAARIYNKEEFEIQFSTVYAYTCRASNELYGKPSSLIGGERGNCRWVLCVRDLTLVDSNHPKGQLRWFTPEEYQKKKELKHKYFNESAEERKKKDEIRESLALQLKKKDISEEEYKDELFTLEQNQAYDSYLEALAAILPEKCILDYGIYVEEDLTADETAW